MMQVQKFPLCQWPHFTKMEHFTPHARAAQITTGPEVIKLFSCSIQLSMKVIMLINVKMPTIVGISTVIIMINTTSERLKAIRFFIYRYFGFYEQLKFCAQLS